MILLKIEALRHSEKVVRARLFRKIKGKVGFGPWFYHSLDQLASLSASGVANASLEEYTSVKILKSILIWSP